MGQYHHIVNLDKREYLNARCIGVGLKAWEQLVNTPSTPQALFILLTCSNGRGGGDLKMINEPEPVRGRWAGDRIAVIGNYAENNDFAYDEEPISTIWGLCEYGEFREISDLVNPQLNAEFSQSHFMFEKDKNIDRDTPLIPGIVDSEEVS